MIEFSRKIPLIEDYEVIVVGGGPSGCAAAAASARGGAKTLLIESSSSLGGLGTNGLVPFWCGFSNGGKLCCRSIAQTVLEETCRLMNDELYIGVKEGADNPEKFPWRVGIDAEALKRVYDDLVTGFGASILFNTTLIGVNTDGNGNVENIIVNNQSGLTAYKAKVYIDCTGMGDLIAEAGAEYTLGNAEGKMQAGTMCFTLSGVNMEEYKKVPAYKIYPVDKEKYKYIIDNHSTTAVISEQRLGVNAGHVMDVDGTNAKNISESLIKGRRLVNEIVLRLKELYPQIYGNAKLEKTATMFGVREGRIIKGEYTLTEEDYLGRRIFEDEIARNCYEFDSHDMFNSKETDNYEVAYKAGESHGIPYRCLIPKALNNVLVAGRIISATRRVMGSVRVMATCLATGEGAGTAAAQSVKDMVSIREVDIQKIRKTLKDNGAFIL